MIRGLEHFSCEDRPKELGLLSQRKEGSRFSSVPVLKGDLLSQSGVSNDACKVPLANNQLFFKQQLKTKYYLIAYNLKGCT